MRNITFSACVSTFLLGLMSSASADTISLRVGSGHPIGLLAYTETANKWWVPELKKRIEERTDHTINIQEFHAGQVAKVTEVLESTESGILDVGFTSFIFYPSKGAFQNFTLYLPFSSPSAVKTVEAYHATIEKFPELTQEFEDKHNQVYLGGTCAENYGLGTKFAWTEFADLQGHKIAGAGTNLEWIAGATPVASNLNEAYQSIQSGVYEGYLSASSWWHMFKLNEVAPHFTKADFGAQFIHYVTVNKDVWNSLPDDVKEIMREVSEEWALVTAEACDKNDAEGLKKLAELGVEVREIAPEAKKAWSEALKDFPQRMADDLKSKGYPGAEVMNFYMDKLEELGHEWPTRYVIN